jgi:mRNA-degrading endonuclease YafQ of YafQ-DinJ toxin-antitoxin module
LGRLECREEVTVSAREYDVTGDVTRTISNNIRGDWKPLREMFFRAEWLMTYQVDEDDSEVTHRVEIRMGIRL